MLYELNQHQTRLQFRLLWLALLAAGIFLALFGRLFYLQVVVGEQYSEKALNNRLRSEPILAPRGNIYDRKGQILATNKEAHALRFDPRQLSNAQIYQTLQLLSRYLDSTYEDLRGRIDFRYPQPVYLYHDLSPQELAVVLEHRDRLPGIQIVTSLERYYPLQERMAHFLGHMGQISPDELQDPAYQQYVPGAQVGKGGLERLYEPFLKGVDGRESRELQLRKDETDPVYQRTEPIPGHDLRLTIDKDLQTFCYELLKKQGVAGSIIVMEPQTGELLALVSYPAYDPNLFNKGLSQAQWEALQNDPLHPFLDRSTNAYAPGSIYKVVSTLAALGTGHLTPARQFISRGSLRVSGHLFYDWNRQGFGQVDIHQALAHSIDTVYYELSQEMGMQAIEDYSERFALGHPTGVDLPAEASGLIPSPAWKQQRLKQPWMPGDAVNASIGQGFVQMTPLQAVRMTAAVANGGYLVPPHLVQKIGGDVQGLSPARPAAVPVADIPPADWQTVRRGLEEAVTYGTAKVLKMPRVRVAAKTGTAETIPGKKDHAWIIAYAPAESPRYAMTVFLEHGGSGGGKAAPLGRKVFDYLFGNS
ncbi:MAG: penicillin-binding protein 2 [Candidatus Sericytochromatia bacterium]|nr:penicillin-binding protein 2 [Candidatus Sericytochromatia bacterium]